LIRRCAAAQVASKFGVLTRPSTMTFPGASACTIGAPVASACRASVAGVSGVISTSTRSARSSAASLLRLTATAIGSPTNRTTSRGRIGCATGM
jgi:hypothetical protein